MINFTTIQSIDGAWKYTWADGLGAVRVVLWGGLLAATSDNSYTYNSALYNTGTMPPPVEVVLSGELAISEQNLCFINLQWYRVVCSYYEVEYWKSPDWISQGSIPDDPGIDIVSFSTPLLDDQKETRWRVTAIADTKRESDPLEFLYAVVRPPNPPSLPTLACSGGVLSVQ